MNDFADLTGAPLHRAETVLRLAVVRAMAFDVGSKTVGIAVSDPLGISAQPVQTLRRTNWKDDLKTLGQLVREYEVTVLVVGLAFNMNGSEGPRAVECRKFGDRLGAEVDLPVAYWDERLTSVAAERALLEGNASRAKRREVIDQLAAVLILQGWLEARPT